METTKETIEKQLEYIHARDSMVFEQRGNIKNWGVTVWAGVIAFSLTNKTNLGVPEAWVLLLAPPILFWIIEGFFAGTTLLTVQQARNLEKRLSENNYSYTSIDEIYAISGFSAFSAKARFITMLQGLIIGTVSIYFGLLTLASIFIAIFFFSKP